ncbi:hypothetical protein Vi05172_g1129 [Venturia inaequalis]|nr:hypothetical protein Vi05172_g1129 [Venturia inaequalis]
MSPGVKFTASTTSPVLTATGTLISRLTSTPSSRPSSTSRLDDPTSPPNPVLTTGAKAGIGIGAVSVVLAFVAIGLLVWRRRHRYNALHNTSDRAGNNAPDVVPSNWNEGHDLPEVVQDKKDMTTTMSTSAEKTSTADKLSKFFVKKNIATPASPDALSGGAFLNGKEVVPRSNDEPLPAPPQHTGVYLSSAPRQSQQTVAESGLEVAERQSPIYPAVSQAELEALRQEHTRIQDERQRLSRMQALDEEERRVRQRIEQISTP